MTGLTLPEWIAVSRKMVQDQRALHIDERYMQKWLRGLDACLNALESDLKTGLLQGVVQ